MKYYFVDTNVVLDLLAKRVPFVVEAAQLFEAAAQGRAQLYIASLSFNNLHYILRKTIPSATLVNLLEELTQLVQIVAVDAVIVRQALGSGLPDFEDALQYHAAVAVPIIEAIVTRDPKGFRNSNLPVLTPAEALTQLT